MVLIMVVLLACSVVMMKERWKDCCLVEYWDEEKVDS